MDHDDGSTATLFLGEESRSGNPHHSFILSVKITIFSGRNYPSLWAIEDFSNVSNGMLSASSICSSSSPGKE